MPKPPLMSSLHDERGGAAAARLWPTSLGGRTALAALSIPLMLVCAPPWNASWLSIVALVPLFHVVRASSIRAAFGLGALVGLGTNVVGHEWLAVTLERFASLSGIEAWSIVTGLAGYQAGVLALWAGVGRWLARSHGVSWLVSGPLLIVVLEAAIPFIFPWHLGILAWRAWPLVQIAELGGPAAVSALVVLVNVTVVEGIATWRGHGRPSRAARHAVMVVIVIVAGGLVRAAHVDAIASRAPKVHVGLVQPNFGIVGVEDRKQRGEQQLQTLRTATLALADRGAELVVWPETAFPFLFDLDTQTTFSPDHPWALAPGFRGRLLFGALLHRFGTSGVENGALLTRPGAYEVAARASKNRLLVLGEYIPFADLAPQWAARVRASLPMFPEITPGKGPVLLVDGPLRVAPLVCYEDLLADYVGELARLRPNLLVTLANHSWFGESDAAPTAMALASLRSVEHRRYLARATSTGVSSFTDALGRVTRHGSLVAGGPGAPPETLLEEVALLDIATLAPYMAPFLPWLAALLLLTLVLARRRLRATPISVPQAPNASSAARLDE